MNGRMLAAAIAAIPLAMFAVACRGRDTQVQVVNGPGESLGVSVTGVGEIEAPPDTGFFTIRVNVSATTVAAARDEAATTADALIKSLKANGIADADIKTTGLSIAPRYEYPANKEPIITGYQVTNTVTVKVRKLDAMSKALDDAILAGGDATRLQSIWFGIEDDAELIRQAREAAVKDAREKADQLASASGTKVGRLQQISEGTPAGDLVRNRDDSVAYARSAADVATAIQPGTSKVTVTVYARWLIE